MFDEAARLVVDRSVSMHARACCAPQGRQQHMHTYAKKTQMPEKDGRLLFDANDMFPLGSKFRAKSR